MSVELKPCPWRIHGEKAESLTISGEFYYNESFMPCIGEDCPAFDSDNAVCMKDGAFFRMKVIKRRAET